MKLFTLVASIIALSFQVSAQPLACSDLFSIADQPAVAVAAPEPAVAAAEPSTAPADVQLRIIPMSVLPEGETRTKAQILENLVQMYLAAPFQGNGFKDLTDKGLLRLAHPLSNGETLAFEYRGDRRSGNLVFRLAEISRIYKNGHTIVLEKNPLNESGDDFAMKELTLSASTNIDTAVHEPVAVPVAISGEVLSEMGDWIKRLPLVADLIVVRDVKKQDGLSPFLSWRASIRSNLLFMGKTTKKQVFKFMLLAVVFSGVQNLPTISTITQYIPGYGKAERIWNSDDGVTAKAQKEIIDTLLSTTATSTAEAFKIQNQFTSVIAKAQKTGPKATFESIRSQSAQLAKREQSAGGHVVYYTEEISDSKAEDPLSARIENSGGRAILIASFEHEKQMLLIPIVRKKAGAPVAAAIRITPSEFPKTYQSLTTMIHRKSVK